MALSARVLSQLRGRLGRMGAPGAAGPAFRAFRSSGARASGGGAAPRGGGEAFLGSELGLRDHEACPAGAESGDLDVFGSGLRHQIVPSSLLVPLGYRASREKRFHLPEVATVCLPTCPHPQSSFFKCI
ncbi:hypothetical protein QTO34_008298 [Cnephaeus nilssonii]|uniref:Uncharacterized protein n=1 Tax=Cnephaeus nilssonii TaxID=3371016 RepID=A0AA40IA20_CNENI|nr:hypothetical protein QTO34_008298 [Eptesicus nilssonii]